MKVVVVEHTSAALRSNPLKDSFQRQLHIIVPDDHDPSVPVPCVWYLAGYAGVGRSMLSHDPWQEGLAERLERLTQEKKIGPMIVVLPDAFTKLGGCQYLSSPALGDYETYLFSELVGVITERYAVSAHAIAGKSSGGYGAIVQAMKRPELFSAVACHSGDMGFELSLIPDLPTLMNAVRDHGGVEAMVAAFDRAKTKKSGRWFGPLSMLALAAAYSPDANEPMGIGLPFDIERGILDPDRIAQWKARDPVNMVERPAYQDALRSMKLVFIDCGSRDEHALHWGALALHRKLDAAGIRHAYESFDAGHRSTSYRLDESFPRLYAALTSS